MISLIVGKKGTGKTKAIIDAANNAKNTEQGDVIFICDAQRHIYSIDHAVRLIDINEYDHSSFKIFLSFINGVLAQNYDITHIFIDSLLKICPEDADNLSDFVTALDTISAAKNVKFTATISADASELPEAVQKYIN